MTNRAHLLKGIRPEFPSSTINDHMSSDERFQNITLRPIIKLQNDLLIEVFRTSYNRYDSMESSTKITYCCLVENPIYTRANVLYY